MSNAPMPLRKAAAARMASSLFLLLFAAVTWVRAATPSFEFHSPSSAGDATVAATMRDLAERLLPVYQEPDPDRYLANLSALQMAAGNYGAAYVSRQSLRDRRRRADAGRPVGRDVIYDMYAHARAMEAQNHLPFADAFAKSYREVVPRLNDLDAYTVTEWLATSPAVFRDALQKAFDQQRTEDSIGQSEAVDLIRAYLSFDAYRSFGPLVDSLDTEDDHRRYDFDNDVLIKRATASVLPPCWCARRLRPNRCPRCSSSRFMIRRTMPRNARRTAMSEWWPTRVEFAPNCVPSFPINMTETMRAP
jgi:hypothetical protein